MTIDHPQGQGRFFSAADLATIAAVHDARAAHGMGVDEIGAALEIPADDHWSALQSDRESACQVPDDAFSDLFQDYSTTAVLPGR
jgi:DNA-binding transcriptional MerR regulator